MVDFMCVFILSKNVGEKTNNGGSVQKTNKGGSVQKTNKGGSVQKTNKGGSVQKTSFKIIPLFRVCSNVIIKT